MDARFYNSEEIDIQRLANDLENMYRVQGYEVQQLGNKDQMMVQLKKGSDLVALLGLQAALSVSLQHTAGGTVAMIGQQRWMDKAAVGAVGLIAAPVLWPLMITAGVGAIQQASLGNQVANALDVLARQQNPNVQVGPIPPEMMPQYEQPRASQPPPWRQWAFWGSPATPPNTVVCPKCQAVNDAGDGYCMRCGQALGPQKVLCSNCGAEAKPGAAFCTKCGTPVSQSQPAE